jgi:hypothetical protein
MVPPAVLRWIKALSLTTMLVVVVAGMFSCGGGSNDDSNTSFSGVNQTYILSSGSRKLQLQGLKGTYSAVTFSGSNSIAVSLTRHTIAIGGAKLPYLADHNFFQSAGYVGYAESAVIDDPAKVAGTFNTLTGANFSGQLTITSDDKYTWCQHGNFNGTGGCTDGSSPIAGTVVPIATVGFKFSGIAGNYAAYQQGAAAAIFPVDNRGLNLKAVSQNTMVPKGTFSECLMSAATKNHIAKVTFSDQNKLTIDGVQNFGGTYTYSYANGEISFPSSACRNGTCAGIYNDQLGIVYLAQIGDAMFFKR